MSISSKARGPDTTPIKPATPEPEIGSLDEHDPVDQASYDSFPASDPPAYASRGTRSGSKRSKP